MSYLHSAIGKEKFYELLDLLFESKINNYRPNRNHFFIANLAKKEICKQIFTTNFDTLIEDALVCIGLKKDKDFVVIYDNYLNKVQQTKNLIQVIKIHGCVTEKTSIVTAMEALVNDEIRDREVIIQSIFKKDGHKKLWSLGYGFSDKYDVNEHIKDLIKKDVSSKEMIRVTRSQTSVKQFIDKDALKRIEKFREEGENESRFIGDAILKKYFETTKEYPVKKKEN